MKVKFKILSIILVGVVSILVCSSKGDNSLSMSINPEVSNPKNSNINISNIKGGMSDYGLITNDIGSGFVAEVDIDRPIKDISKIFDGGGQEVEIDNIVRYLYADKEIRTLKTDTGSSIYYLSTKNVNDKTIRGIGIGDSLDELLEAYPEEQLVFQKTWDSVVASDYDTAFKLVKHDESRQTVFLLKENIITMIQIADMQDNNNIRFSWDFIK